MLHSWSFSSLRINCNDLNFANVKQWTYNHEYVQCSCFLFLNFTYFIPLHFQFQLCDFQSCHWACQAQWCLITYQEISTITPTGSCIFQWKLLAIWFSKNVCLFFYSLLNIKLILFLHDVVWIVHVLMTLSPHLNFDYCQITNIRHTLASNTIVHHSDIVGASPFGAAPTAS